VFIQNGLNLALLSGILAIKRITLIFLPLIFPALAGVPAAFAQENAVGYFMPPSRPIKAVLSFDQGVVERADGSIGVIHLGQENDDDRRPKPILPDRPRDHEKENLDRALAVPTSSSTSKAILPEVEGLMISGIKFQGTGPLPASTVQTFVSTLAITDALDAGVHVQLLPHQATEGVSLNYKLVNFLTITTNLDRRIVGTDIGSTSPGLGLGLESSDPAQFDMGIQAEFIVHFGGSAAR
jgi:hypothetical protein